MYGGKEMHKRFWWKNLTAKDRLEDPSVDRMLTLKLILKKQDRWVSTGSIWLWKERVASSCEYGNKISGFLKRGKFLN
jgi:hypothetical protein